MGQTAKKGLGRGFESLLPSDFNKNSLLQAEERIEKIDVGSLLPSPYQPRKHFDETALKELAASIKRHGVVQPLVVTPQKDGKYTLVAGERRWRASQIAGLATVPAIVRDRKELEQMEVALIENVQRVDLGPLEQAASIQRLYEQFSLSYEDIAKRLGKATSTVNNHVRLLQLPEEAKQALAEHKISEGHARAILALKDKKDQQLHLLSAIITEGWSVRQAERYVMGIKQGAKEKKEATKHVETETPATKALSKRLHTPVHIRRTAKGGKLEITFKSDDELERILSLF